MLPVVKLLLVFMVVAAAGTASSVDTSYGDTSVDASCPTKAASTNKCPLKSLPTPALKYETQLSQEKGQERILVFVSFSMPEASLKALAQAAEAANAVLIIRGLIEDSFKVTAERLKDFAQGVEVNPELFERYNIQHTPTFVRIKDGNEQARLSGNVTLAWASQKFKEAS